MITEDYVSFETAKLLKEKGFNEMTELAYGLEHGNIRSDLPVSYWRNSEIGEYKFSCPTLQMAIKWLRKNYNIEIEISSNYENTEHNSIEYSAIVTKYIFGGEAKTYPILNPSRYDSYELAEEAAIKYCLENLI